MYPVLEKTTEEICYADDVYRIYYTMLSKIKKSVVKNILGLEMKVNYLVILLSCYLVYFCSGTTFFGYEEQFLLRKTRI